MLLGGCSGERYPNPVGALRELTGANLAARLPPPGIDGPSPHLGMVPARPDRPDSATLAAITRSLVEDRNRAAEPLGSRGRPAPPGAEAPGSPPIPAAPPPRPALASAPAVPWAAPGGAGAFAPVEPAGSPRAGQELAPGAAPALPPPDLLAPRGAEPGAPGAPPPPPPPDLLGGGTRR